MRSRTWRIQALIIGFMVALVLSGLTAFPILTELRWLHPYFRPGSSLATVWPEMAGWLQRVHSAYEITYVEHEFIGYGTDWLAFAHLLIAGAFWGVWKDPTRNIWVVEWAMFSCVAVIPLAVICGPIRGIPWFWTCVDCSFGVFGLLPLYWLRREIRRVQIVAMRASNPSTAPPN